MENWADQASFTANEQTIMSPSWFSWDSQLGNDIPLYTLKTSNVRTNTLINARLVDAWIGHWPASELITALLQMHNAGKKHKFSFEYILLTVQISSLVSVSKRTFSSKTFERTNYNSNYHFCLTFKQRKYVNQAAAKKMKVQTDRQKASTKQQWDTAFVWPNGCILLCDEANNKLPIPIEIDAN